jgi:hypothetical protein
VEQRYVIKFFAEGGMKGVGVIDGLNRHHDGNDLIQWPQSEYEIA